MVHDDRVDGPQGEADEGNADRRGQKRVYEPDGELQAEGKPVGTEAMQTGPEND